MKKTMMLLALVLVLGTVLTGCGKKDAKLGEIKKAGKIVMGTNAEYPPYEFHADVNGKDSIVGLDVSIAQEVAKELGLELEIKDMAFDGLLAALTSGKIDFIVAGMTPTPERMKKVDFSKIYYTAQQGIIVRADEKYNFKTMESLNGKKIGVQMGSTQEEIAQTQVTGADITSITSISDLILQLESKKVDALIVELPVAQVYVAKKPALVIADATPKDDVGGSAIAVQKNNPSLVSELDKVIDRLTTEKKIDQFFVDAAKLMEE
ncbi:MAG: transporter substrate-binding domain-containing protein [Gorillibacterium sp.]|nr:transporter substrate-binding domain-containing protein [Gorillibacterium sp.]